MTKLSPEKILPNNIKYLGIIALTMFYVTCKLTCNPIFFRNTMVTIPLIGYTYKTTGSAFVFPLIYILSDIILSLTNRRVTLIVIVVGIICDGLSSYFITQISIFSNPEIPILLNKANAILVFGPQMWTLFFHGFIGSCIANIVEIILFYTLIRKFNSFFIAASLSSIVVLLIHNIITDFYIMQHDADRFSVILHNTLSESVIIIGYTVLITFFINIIKVRYIFQRI